MEGNNVLSEDWAEDFFQSRPTDGRFECVKLQKFYPIESLTNASVITFILPRFMGPNIYLPSRMLLKVAVQLKIKGADAIPAANKVAPINNTFHSLFKSCRVWVGETLLTKNGENYPFKSYMIDFLSMDSNAKFSWMRAQMWHQDTFGHTLATQTDPNVNAGFKSRMHRFQTQDQSAYVTHSIPLMGRLHSDLASLHKGLCPGIGMRLELGLSSDDFLIQVPSTGTSKYELKITDAVLLCPVGQLSLEMFRKIEHKLESKNIKMYLKRTEVTNKNIPANSQLFVDQLFAGAPLPAKMVITVLPTASYVGTQHTNPFFFGRAFARTKPGPGVQVPRTSDSSRRGSLLSFASTSGPDGLQDCADESFIEKVQVTLNGEDLDGLEAGSATCTEDIANFVRLHYFMGFMESRTGNAVTYEEFMNGFFFLYYDLSTNGQASDEYEIPAVRQGNLRIQMNFSATHPQELTLLIFAEYPTLLQVDKYKQLSMSY